MLYTGHPEDPFEINAVEYKFIHSRYFFSASFKSTTTQRRSRHSTDIVSEFHAEAPQATVSEELAQGPSVAARAGVKATTLRLTVCDSTNKCFKLSTKLHN